MSWINITKYSVWTNYVKISLLYNRKNYNKIWIEKKNSLIFIKQLAENGLFEGELNSVM